MSSNSVATMRALETDVNTTSSNIAPSLSGKIPSLDGLRAISIILVLCSHLDGTRFFPAIVDMKIWGPFGVQVFFIISGFLITTLLLNEYQRNQRISLKNFYLRRLFRIFPAFYLYVLVIALANSAGWVVLRRNDLLHALTYTMNYHYPHSWFLAHIWSLSVEEQFYLLWPALMILLGPLRALWATVPVIVLLPVVRVAIFYLVPSHREGVGHEFHTIADALATGCLLAGIYNWLGSREKFVKFIASRWFAVIPVLSIAVNFLHEYPSVFHLFGQTIINGGVALTIYRFVRFPNGFIGAALNSKIMVVIGVLSYSLYLWQQPFLNRNSHEWWSVFPINISLAFAAAALSYICVEKPFLKLKEQFSSR